MKERILSLLGQVGKETSIVYTHEKVGMLLLYDQHYASHLQVAEVLWTISHEEGLEMPLVIMALRAQLGVVNEHSKDGLREIYVNKCMEDLAKVTPIHSANSLSIYLEFVSFLLRFFAP
jgi:hypothetical protein